MEDRLTGGCLCGAVRFEIAGEVGPAAYCHCTDCRRVTGSAFNVSVRLDKSRFRLVAGTPRGFTSTADSGHELSRHFCGDCGSPLYTTSPRRPDDIYLKAGVIDDSAVIRPAYQSWTRSAVPWAIIGPDLPGHEKDRSRP